MTTIVIIDSKPFFRLGVEHYLKNIFPNINVKCCSSITEHDQLFYAYACDLILLSIKSNECISTAIKSIQQQFLCSKLLLLSDSLNIPKKWVNLPDSVIGYIGYETQPQQLVNLIENTLGYRPEPEKQISIKPCLASNNRIPVPIAVANQDSKLLTLTRRQYAVLVHLAHGYTNAEISNQLNISISTVRKHTQDIFFRLGVRNRNQAVFKSLELGADLALHRKQQL